MKMYCEFCDYFPCMCGRKLYPYLSKEEKIQRENEWNARLYRKIKNSYQGDKDGEK